MLQSLGEGHIVMSLARNSRMNPLGLGIETYNLTENTPSYELGYWDKLDKISDEAD